MHYKWLLFTLPVLFTSLWSEALKLPTHIIHITGQKQFDESTLHDALSIERKSIFTFRKEGMPRIQDKLLPTLPESLKSFYDSEGFYDAAFTIKETNTTVSVVIDEKRPVRINDITVLSDYNIDSFVTLKKGERFRAIDFSNSKSMIIQSLLEDGYCSYDLDTKAYVDLQSHKADLYYSLKKGDICTFGETNIKGLEHIDKRIILAKIVAYKDRRYSTKHIKETYRNIYALDVFESIVINTNRKFYNKVPVDIVLKEVTKPYYIKLGVGYDTYTGKRLHGEFTKKNFLGNAQKLSFKASWSQREQLISWDFDKPVLFFLYHHTVDLGLKVGFSNLEYKGFQEEKDVMRGQLFHEHGRFKVRTGLTLENIKISLLSNLKGNEVLEQAVSEGTFLLFYPYIDLIYDARDSKLNPKYGYYISVNAEYGIAYDDKASDYMKTAVEARFIHTFSDLTLAAVAKAGVTDQTSGAIPESKMFFAGGAYSNRAYGYNSIGVILSFREDTIQGASTMANLSLEADYPLWGDLYGALFTDNTMLNEKSYDFIGDIITSVGVGVRYMTPIGPFKLDAGFNVHDSSQYAVSFQIGHSF